VTSVTCETTSTPTMPPKKQQQSDKLQLDPPKSNNKGKGCSKDPDPPSLTISGSQPKGKAPGVPAYTPGEQKEIPMPPKKKTPAERQQEQEEAEEACEASCQDILFNNLKKATECQAQQLLGVPAWQGADNLATTPSISTSASLPLSSHGISP
jgi:hypothetical protein